MRSNLLRTSSARHNIPFAYVYRAFYSKWTGHVVLFIPLRRHPWYIDTWTYDVLYSHRVLFSPHITSSPTWPARGRLHRHPWAKAASLVLHVVVTLGKMSVRILIIYTRRKAQYVVPQPLHFFHWYHKAAIWHEEFIGRIAPVILSRIVLHCIAIIMHSSLCQILGL